MLITLKIPFVFFNVSYVDYPSNKDKDPQLSQVNVICKGEISLSHNQLHSTWYTCSFSVLL